jgi:hypothetical protein
VRPSPFTRHVALMIAGVLAAAGALTTVAPSAQASTQTACHGAALPRQRTEVNADLAVPRFDPSLGTLLSVSVPTQTVHLDTNARFQNTAQSSVVFSEDMHYSFTFASPAGLASPGPLTGTIARIPPTTLAPFSGTLDYQGPSAVTEPPTARDAAAPPESSSDPAVLAAFTGAGSLPFHLQSAIAEVFHGGGGNVVAEINTFVAATVQVCYTYGVAEASVAPPPVAPAPPPPTVVAPPRLTG